ncbi:hypothetical protein ASPSYDRAFT_44402 [Aspergillus sydowii CBS 593.65]|uniref:Uncharacterized protein n=1 Tax=Aspergillus sydowii CBS 593.65 TaxID=1036612 RepID=A0A1L9TKU6_9EURO|nr:uncharacterized protein ASPSYDRAFT_44402 [Aspergillus sydowii CBS 593.65]OJJ60001.1 hypothetical protein ASPSYDRAFT_44402 [Aspergillus sydowii CBS 593.65]
MPHIILLGTLDTKRSETLYLHDQLHQAALRVSQPIQTTLIDCGCRPTTDDAITITQPELIAKYGPPNKRPTKEPWELPRGEAIKFLSDCATRAVAELLSTTEEIHGIVGTGGSGGTSLISSVMRDAAPIGLPKLIVSTVASGNTGPVVGECDITLMYSVVDIAGSNRLLRDVLENAAGAIFGMASAYQHRLIQRHHQEDASLQGTKKRKTRIGITMFGVTTPCVDQIRAHLEEKHPDAVEIYVFHATGHGGKAMERLVEEGQLDAILDITTTEICDLVAGGEMSCEEDRLEKGLRRGIPNIISVGATDMVNFGPMDTVPPKYKERKLFVHNPSVTLMRTNREESNQIASFIVDKIKRFASDPGMVEVWIPQGGVSSISTKGKVFEDGHADGALFGSLVAGLDESEVKIVSDTRDVNDPGFAADISDRLMELVEKHAQKAS